MSCVEKKMCLPSEKFRHLVVEPSVAIKIKITVRLSATVRLLQFHKIRTWMLWFPYLIAFLGHCREVRQGGGSPRQLFRSWAIGCLGSSCPHAGALPGPDWG